MINWQEALIWGAPPFYEVEFRALRSNLRSLPHFVPNGEERKLFMESTTSPDTAWCFKVTADRLTSRWIPFLDLETAETTYKVQGGQLLKTVMRPPTGRMTLRRIITRYPQFSQKLFRLGAWEPHQELFTQ